MGAWGWVRQGTPETRGKSRKEDAPLVEEDEVREYLRNPRHAQIHGPRWDG